MKAAPIGSVAFVAAMEAPSGSQFAAKVVEVTGSWGEEVATKLRGREAMLEQFWALVSSIEKAYFDSTAVQLGFGLCEFTPQPLKLDPLAGLRKQSAIAALLKPAPRPPKRAKVAQPDQASATPLLDKERHAKWHWASRLEAVGRRAGVAARLFQEHASDSELSEGERLKLKQLVLTNGAHRTMAAHIQTFERLEKWAGALQLDLYPLTIDKVLKYCVFLGDRECGPSVLPNFRAGVKWVCQRLAIDPPPFDDARFVALQNQIIVARAKTLKEAVPIPIGVVKELETFAINPVKPDAARLFIWWILCMVFASLRFDDAIHVRPGELHMGEEGLYGVAWQTKVDRKRVGTRFVVPMIGFRESAWLEVGWELFLATQSLDRDFWIPELNTPSEFKTEPPSFARTLQWLKVYCRRLSDESSELTKPQQVRHAIEINKLTMHSCRVTLLDAAVHAGRTTEEIGLQANWKNPGPLVLKYTRNRSAVPALMVKQLVRDLVQGEHPVQEDENTILVDSNDHELSSFEFFIKNPSPGSYYEYKYHCTSGSDEGVTACNKFNLADCSSVGETLPDLNVLCKACARARPEVATFFGHHAEAASSASAS